jgi:hypothetical protein
VSPAEVLQRRLAEYTDDPHHPILVRGSSKAFDIVDDLIDIAGEALKLLDREVIQ